MQKQKKETSSCTKLIGIPGHPFRKTNSRAIGFFVDEADKNVNARSDFDSLSESQKRRFNFGFQSWMNGNVNKGRFHGWDLSEHSGKYTKCFVFKGGNTRIYGFLGNPTESPRSQVCGLVLMATKNNFKTDTTFLDKVVSKAESEDIQEVIDSFWRDFSEPD